MSLMVDLFVIPFSFLLPTSSLRRLKSGVVSSTHVPLRLTGTSTHMSSAKSKYSFFLCKCVEIRLRCSDHRIIFMISYIYPTQHNHVSMFRPLDDAKEDLSIN